MAHDKNWKAGADKQIANTQRTRSEPNTSSTHSEHEANTQETHSEHWKGRKASELETFSIRLTGDDKRRLAAYFERRGLAVSQGLRMWILERMDAEGLS